MADYGNTVDSFSDSVGGLVSSLASVKPGSLLLALLCFLGYLLLRSRAIFNALRAAYPAERIQWRRAGGAYMAAVGLKNVIPSTAASIVQIGLTKASIERSSYSAVTSAIGVGAIFDTLVSLAALGFAISQGAVHMPPGFSTLQDAGPSYFALAVALLLVLGSAAVIVACGGIASLRLRLSALWARVRQGFAVLRDRRRYVREVASWQAGSWVCRFAAFWLMLDAFGVGGSLRGALLVQGLLVASTLIPVTPGGAGVQQALLVTAFAGAAPRSALAAYAIGQQLVLASFSLLLGLIALAAIFRVRSFGAVLRRSRAERAAEAPA